MFNFFKTGPDLGDNDSEPLVLPTNANGKDLLWYPDLDGTIQYNYNYLLLLLVSRNGEVTTRHLKVKSDYQMMESDLEHEHLIIMQQLSISISMITFPNVTTVIGIFPIQQLTGVI